MSYVIPKRLLVNALNLKKNVYRNSNWYFPYSSTCSFWRLKNEYFCYDELILLYVLNQPTDNRLFVCLSSIEKSKSFLWKLLFKFFHLSLKKTTTAYKHNRNDQPIYAYNTHTHRLYSRYAIKKYSTTHRICTVLWCLTLPKSFMIISTSNAFDLSFFLIFFFQIAKFLQKLISGKSCNVGSFSK